ncbi:AMP-binding enzyme family protein (macronuclear) [Tetrahymena thermophila SB210]|uniref:AMP-binding enzyme family protein n=1 Tax=Tetrahymena thermophila (strain SB210) TaxID=312017 RepID=Q23JE6_TETTS|nr:AMP-binding enzyme family protein [Tetrahymena thermophila SB210]EAR96558.2 AMP-binding enzyme family protein [Tetrahymena thermophila SB210]|eukprot:XP_001016803.2 AMP-binding enzyme family protein [Tetrahymena thermophila SB210]
MKIVQFDLFSSEFYFNLDGTHFKKGTVHGVILSLASITLILSYFFYLLHLYLNNLIDPLFKSQSFITNNRKEVELTQDLIGFQFTYNNSLSIDQYQNLQNKTYLVYYPYFYYQDTEKNVYSVINLDVIQCSSPDLKGFNCIDFSKISNYTLVSANANNIMSMVYINIYGCLDIDSIKTTIPNNCASQSEIDDVINGGQAGLVLQLKTQQYNTTSMQIQTNYRFIQTFSLSNQFILNTLKTQMQETQVKKGLLIQGQQFYSSPIQYDQTTFSFDRQVSLQTGVGPYCQVTLLMDEIVQYIEIQYPTITQILALVNSVSFIVMVCRNREEEFADEISENQNKMNVNLPNFQSKFLDRKQNTNFYLDQSNSFQRQKLQVDDDNKQKDSIKFNDSLISLTSTKSQQTKQKNFINIQKFDKSDTISYNQSQFTQQIESKIFGLQKIETPSQRQSVNKSELPKSNFLKKDHFKWKKNFGEAISQKLKVMKSNEMKQAIQKTIFKYKFFQAKEYLQSLCLKEKQMNKIKQEVQKSLNIYELYKDIIFLKKAVSILLSTDQMAAIQLISLTDNFINIDVENRENESQYNQERNKLNHFEKQYLISQSENLQINYIERFLIKCQDGDDLSEIDQRIIQSISKKH